MSKRAPCPSKEEKPELPCPVSRSAAVARCVGGGSPGGAAPVPVCPSPGCSSSPHTPRHDEAGLIHSSHRRVLFFDISCSAFLPVSLSAWGGTAGGPQPTGTLFTVVEGKGVVMPLLTGPQLRRCSRALVANGLAFPRVPSRGAKCGGWGGGEHCLAILGVPSSPASPHQHLCDVFSFVPVPESSTRQGLPAPSPALCG